MKISAGLMVGLLAGSMTLGMVGCKGEPPEPPLSAGQTINVSNGAKISVESFKIAKPDFLDANGRAAHPVTGQEEVAVLRLKIENGSGSEINYRPLHFNDAKSRIQLCTNPNPDNGDRANIRAIAFDAAAPYHTPDQKIDSAVAIAAGSSIVDDYLFERPAEKGQLVVLIPDAIVGAAEGKVLRVYVNEATAADEAELAGIKSPVEIDGMEMSITSVGVEYAELVPKAAPATPLKYAYAYSKNPVIAVRVSITNNDKKAHAYDPAHNSATAGISLKFAGSQLSRVKFDNAYGKGQVSTAKRAVEPGETVTDVYYFEVPGNGSRCVFEVSGNVLSVSGIYRYAFDLELTTPEKPDLEPYKRAAAAGAAEGEENAEGEEGEEGEEEEGSEEGAAEGDAAAAAAPAAE